MFFKDEVTQVKKKKRKREKKPVNLQVDFTLQGWAAVSTCQEQFD